MIAPGQTHTVHVLFAPTTAGAHSATLRIVSDDANEATTDVPLSGTGVLVPVPEITVTPASHDYGPLVINSQSASQSFEIRNDGTADLQVTSISVVGASADFSITSGAGAVTLGPG